MTFKVFPPSRNAGSTCTSAAVPCGKKRWHLGLLLQGLLLTFVSFEFLRLVVYGGYEQAEDQFVEQQARKMNEQADEKQRHLHHFSQQLQKEENEEEQQQKLQHYPSSPDKTRPATGTAVEDQLVKQQNRKMNELSEEKQQRLHHFLEQLEKQEKQEQEQRRLQHYPSSPNKIKPATGTAAGEFDERTPYYLFGKYQYRFYAKYPNPTTENRKALYLLRNEPPSWIGPSARTTDLFAAGQRLDPRSNYGNPNVSESARILAQLPIAYPEQTDIDTWVLPNPLLHATRNHDTIILERSSTTGSNSVVAVTLLGRLSRYVQWTDLITGQQGSHRTAMLTDPDGWPLDDLNHVSAVLVDALVKDDKYETATTTSSIPTRPPPQEIWLPCGFHNDRVNYEVSTSYARIVDVATMTIRVGPKLPAAGGACVAHAVRGFGNASSKEPPLICTFGGTQGTHDGGKFLRETACYDRLRGRWWSGDISPFGKLPYGLDHGSLAEIPAGVCHPQDPARLLILNFRTEPYGEPHPEILAFDLPVNGWKPEELEAAAAPNSKSSHSDWYWYYNDTRHKWEDTKDVPRDASGTIVVDGGRFIVNFGGTSHFKKRISGRFSMIRAFDVCRKEWNVVGDLGLHTFALQTAASQELQVALTCGGETPWMTHSNGHWCFVNRFHNGMVLSNRYEKKPQEQPK